MCLSFSFMFAKSYPIMKECRPWKDPSAVLYKWLKGQVELFPPLQKTAVWEVYVRKLLRFSSFHGYYHRSLCCESGACVPCEVTAAV